MSSSPLAEAGGAAEPAPGRAPAVAAESLGVRYADTPALESVDARFETGAISAVVGPSGCGKSSFLAAINRLTDLVPGCRVSGRVHVNGVEAHAPDTDPVLLRRRVGMIFQKPNPFPLSIHRNFRVPLRAHGVRARDEIEQRMESALRDVGLWNEVRSRLRRPASHLSGGQQQRLCLARALALEPSVLLMDEPCSALDPIAGGVVERLITQMRGRLSMIVVTHNLAQARRIADHTAVFWMRDGTGRLIEQGPTQRVFEAPRDPRTAAYVRGVEG
jgi:phosphate transport system ATP-binding protein